MIYGFFLTSMCRLYIVAPSGHYDFFFGYCEETSVVFYLISQFKEDVLFLDLRKGILGKPSVNNIKVNHHLA